MKKLLSTFVILCGLCLSLSAQTSGKEETPDVVNTSLYVAIDEVAPPLGLNRFLEDKAGGSLHNGGTPVFPRFVAGQSIPLKVYFIDQHSTFINQSTTVRHIAGFHRYQGSVISVRLRAAGNNHVYATAIAGSEIAGPFVTASVTRTTFGSEVQEEGQDVVFSDTTANGTFRIYTDFPTPGGTSSLVDPRQARRGWSPPITKYANPVSVNGTNYFEDYAMDLYGYMGQGANFYSINAAGAVTAGPGYVTDLFADGLFQAAFTPHNGYYFYDNGFAIQFNWSALEANHWAYPLPLVQIDAGGLATYGWNVPLSTTASDFNDLWLPANAPAKLEVLLDGALAVSQEITRPAPIYAPVANFTSNVQTAHVGNPISFTDTSANEPWQWSWQFGDGATSTSQNPTHSYSSVGTYTVSLTATNPLGSDGETKTGYITITR
jgi:hypothetical protein